MNDINTRGRNWCPGAESNHRHADFQSAALPTELPGHPGHSVNGCPGGRMAPEVVGFIVDIELSVQSRRAANRTSRGRSVPKGSPDRLVPGFSPQHPPGALAPWDGRANPLPVSISMGPTREIWKHSRAAGQSGAQWPLRGSFSVYSEPTIVEILGLKNPFPTINKASAVKKNSSFSMVMVRWPSAMRKPPRTTARRAPSRRSAIIPPIKGVM